MHKTGFLFKLVLLLFLLPQAVLAAPDDSADASLGAFLAKLQIWSDKFEGEPMGRGELEIMVAGESEVLPGLWSVGRDMAVEQVKDFETTAGEMFGSLPASSELKADTRLFVRLTVLQTFPREEFVKETLSEGTGERQAADGDPIRVHYVGRLENPEEGPVIDSSREREQPFAFLLGDGAVIPGWELGLRGMKKGEVRRLSIPHYLAYGTEEKEDIPAQSRLYYDVELVEFISEGDLETVTVKEGSGEPLEAGQKGRFHYTGWLDKMEGEKFDSSLDRSQEFEVEVGTGQLIQGWEKGLLGMKPGEVRELVIPWNLAYGAEGRPPVIPPYSDLFFRVEYFGLVEND